jgi:hypothetical protein
MTKALDGKIGMSAPDKKVLEDIQRFGWHVVSVFAQADEEEPGWAFSIGMFQTFAHPEVIIFGLPLDRCANIINEIGKAIRAGQRFESRKEYADILAEPYMCAFRQVPDRQYGDYVGYALWFYERDGFPLLQCFWPDKHGNFPWDESCNEYVRKAQPLLFAT